MWKGGLTDSLRWALSASTRAAKIPSLDSPNAQTLPWVPPMPSAPHERRPAMVPNWISPCLKSRLAVRSEVGPYLSSTDTVSRVFPMVVYLAFWLSILTSR